MPKIGRMTEEQRRAAAFKREIMALCKRSKYGGLYGVVEAMGDGYKYANVCALLTRGRIRAETVGKIFKLTGADNDTIVRLMRL